MTFIVKLNLNLRKVKINRTAGMAHLFARIAEISEGFQHRKKVSVFLDCLRLSVHKHFIDDIVCQAPIYTDNRRDYFVAFYVSIRGNLHLACHGETVLSLIKAADTVGKLKWKHRYNAVNKIHTCSACIGFLVKRFSLPNIPAHIGNIYAQKPAAVFSALGIDSIIKVLRIIAVNRNGCKITAVAASFIFLRHHRLLNMICLFLHLWGKFL